MALGVVHGAEDKGYKIPDDFEVIPQIIQGFLLWYARSFDHVVQATI